MPNNQNVAAVNKGTGGGASKFGKWDCNVCGIADNWATRARCRICDAYGPRGPGGGGSNGGSGGHGGRGFSGNSGQGSRGAGGASNAGGGARAGVSTGGGVATYAQKQLQRQNEDQRLQRQREEARKREDALRLANQKLTKDLAAARAGHKPKEEDDDMDDDEEVSEEDRQKRIDALQKAMPYFVLQYGEDSAQVEGAKSEIEELQRALREAKPYKTHRGQLERKLDRLQKQQQRAREEEDELLVEVERTQEKLNKLRSAISEREKSITAVDDELKDLLRKAIAESDSAENPPATVAPDPHIAWTTVNQALASMAAQPGVPAAWAAQLGSLLEQVRVAALAMQQQAGMAPQQVSPMQCPSPVAAAAASSTASSSSASSCVTAAAAGSTQTTTNSWEARVHELVFTEGGSRSGNEGRTEGATGSAGDGNAETATTTTSGNGPASTPVQEATTAATPAVPPSSKTGDGPDSDIDDSDDDMESVAGNDLDRREGESAAQHKTRAAKLFKERATKRREARLRDGKAGKKKDGKEGKTANRDKVNQKKK